MGYWHCISYCLILAGALVVVSVDASIGSDSPQQPGVAAVSPDVEVKSSDHDSDVCDVNGGMCPSSSIMTSVGYLAPNLLDLEYAETFDGDVFSRWLVSKVEKFTGEWKHVTREKEAIKGDYGIKTVDDAKHHAIASRISNPMMSNEGKATVISYEAKFESGLHCGGAYLKLYNSNGKPLDGFSNETPYSVMFGPDRCGATNKVHLIIRRLNPKSNKWSVVRCCVG